MSPVESIDAILSTTKKIGFCELSIIPIKTNQYPHPQTIFGSLAGDVGCGKVFLFFVKLILSENERATDQNR